MNRNSFIIAAALIRRDLLIGWRSLGDSFAAIAYYAIIIALLPLALGPSPEALRLVAPAMLWIGALLATLPQMARLFGRKTGDGSLDEMILIPLALPLVVLAKIVAAWLLTAPPLLLTTPLLAIMLGLPLAVLPMLILSIAIGTVGLLLLGSMMGAIAIGARRTQALVAVMMMPLAIPILIFGVGAVDAALEGATIAPHLALLCATTLLLLGVAPPIVALSLKIAAE